MKLSTLYSNLPEKFTPLVFNRGLNVIIAETSIPDDKEKHTHNLGKTTLCKLIDFCLMAQRNVPWSFELFKDFVFYLEIILNDGSYLTIQREVKSRGKVSLKYSLVSENYLSLTKDKWDHYRINETAAKEIVDGKLNLTAQKGFPFRKGLAYFLRTQDEYIDLFRIAQKGKDKDWKPFLAHLMGYNAQLFTESYILKEKLASKKTELEKLGLRLPSNPTYLISKTILSSQKIAKLKEAQSVLNFHEQDNVSVNSLVDRLDTEIVDLNNEIYKLQSSKKRIEQSISEKDIPFEVEKAKQLFEEFGILFPNQLRNDFESLIQFNRIITRERNEYLKSDLIEIEAALETVQKNLISKNTERSALIGKLYETDIFKKYRYLNDEIARENMILFKLEDEKRIYDDFLAVQTDCVDLESELSTLQNDIENEVNNPAHQDIFKEIIIVFDSIVNRILNIQAVINISINKEKNIEFKESLLNDQGQETCQDDGHTYKKFLCIAFDLALLRVYHSREFFRMVFHDGPFEALDNRMKLNLIELMREYANDGIQQIITVIDSDVSLSEFKDEEVILRLNDSGPQGRLFKMESW